MKNDQTDENETKFPMNNLFGKDTHFESKGIDDSDTNPINNIVLNPNLSSNDEEIGHSNLNQNNNYDEASNIDDLINQTLNISNKSNNANIPTNDNTLDNNISSLPNNPLDDQNNVVVTPNIVNDNPINPSDIFTADINQPTIPDNQIIGNSTINNSNNTSINNTNNISYDEEGFESYVKKPLIPKKIMIAIVSVLAVGIIALVVYLVTKTGSLTGVTISSDNIIYFGETTSIKGIATGNGNLNKTNIEFSISDPNIAKLETLKAITGKTVKNTITPYTTGTFSITAKASLINSKVESDSKNIIVCKRLSEETVPPEKIVILLNNPKKININLGPNEECYQGLTFSVESDGIASIDENRIITGKTEGTSALVIKQGDKSVTTLLQILAEKNAVATTGLSVSKKDVTLNIGDTDTLSAVISPAQVSNKNVIWTSNNEKIVTVNTKGVIKAITAGGATITAMTEDGKYKAQTNIIVTDNSITPGEDDTVSPVANLVSIKSNNSSNTTIAKEENIITLTVQFNETLGTEPSIQIAGKNASVVCGTGSTPTCIGTVKVNNIMPRGTVAFKVNDFKDTSGNLGSTITVTTDNSQVKIS